MRGRAALLGWFALFGAGCPRSAADLLSCPDGGGFPDGGPGVTPGVHLVGRFDLTDPAAPRFAWPGSRIAARFDGTEISVELDDGGQNQFDVFIDGAPRPVLKTFPGVNAYELASGLTPGPHDVALARRTESLFGATRFLGFPAATLAATPAPYARMIELVGDSITCGFGDLGDGPDCPFVPDTESESDAYGALTACALDAGHAAIAYSGRGMYRNNDGNTVETMPLLFDRVIADEPGSVWTFAYTPDVVVINLGTNDFFLGDPGAPYPQTYDLFVQKVRGRYPDAWIVVVTSPMLNDEERAAQTEYLTQVTTAAGARGDTRVRLVDLAPQDPADGLGCSFHPTTITHRKIAAQLSAALRGLTGW